MIKLLIPIIALSFLAGYLTCYNVDVKDRQATIRELATVICIANGGSCK